MAEATPKPHDASDAPQTRLENDQVVLVKNGQRFVFRCAAGEEPGLVEQLQNLAGDTTHPLQWFDAAMLCHQLGRRMGQRLPQHQPNPDQATRPQPPTDAPGESQ
jgi:hypothetical protein